MNPWERYGKLLLWILLAASLHTILVGMAIRTVQNLWVYTRCCPILNGIPYGAAPVALKELDEKTKTLMISLGQTICEDCN